MKLSWKNTRDTLIGVAIALSVMLITIASILRVIMLANVDMVELMKHNLNLSSNVEVKALSFIEKFTAVVSVEMTVLVAAIIIVIVYNAFPITLKMIYRTMIASVGIGMLAVLDIVSSGKGIVFKGIKEVLSGKYMAKILGTKQIIIGFVVYAVIQIVIALYLRNRTSRM